MRRVALLVGVAFLAACGQESSSQAPAANLDPHAFAFRDMVALKTTYDDAIKGEALTDCQKDANTGDRTCKLAKTQIASIDVREAHVDFVDDTFDYVDAQFSPADYETLRDKLTGVYGKPCQTEAQEAKWRAKLGFRDRGREVQWCFNNGNLNLMENSRHGWDAGELEFLSNRKATSEKTLNQSNL